MKVNSALEYTEALLEYTSKRFHITGWCTLKRNVGFSEVRSKSITNLMLNTAMSVICHSAVPFILLNEHFHFPEGCSAVHPYNTEHGSQAIYISTAPLQWTCFAGLHKMKDAFK